MVNEFEFYHGLVLAKLIHASKEALLVNNFGQSDNAAYVVNNKVGVYIKYCTKRLTPWRFTFLKTHQEIIQEMKSCFDEVFVLLICHKDGVVILDWNLLKAVLDSTHRGMEWVAVSRGKNRMYSISGTDGVLRYKVSRGDFPDKILKRLEKNKSETNNVSTS